METSYLVLLDEMQDIAFNYFKRMLKKIVIVLSFTKQIKGCVISVSSQLTEKLVLINKYFIIILHCVYFIKTIQNKSNVMYKTF